ncbi:MAG: hypothetical protein LKF81_07255 [Prevotella sp.]|jgi:hypothetical protein|nr:hypothetical protein [Prevotella sp.]
MKEAVSDLIKKVRIAIDEITKGNDDDFVTDADTEIQNAIETSANQILLEAPDDFLLPVPVSTVVGDAANDYDAAQTQYTDGHGSVVVPDDFLKLFEFRLKSWQSTVRELMKRGSEEVKMQASRWSRGTPQKPKAILTVDGEGNRIIMYWTAGRYQYPNSADLSYVYNHTIDVFTYIPKPEIIDVTSDQTTEPTLKAALNYAAEKNLIYRTASIFLEGKKEHNLSDRMYAISKIY